LGSVVEYLERSVKDYPGEVALIESNVALSYGELWARAGALSRVVARMAGGEGRRVCISLHNTMDFVVSCLAVAGAGCVPVLVHAASPAEKISRILEDAGASGFIGHSWMVESLPAPGGDLSFVLTDKPLKPASGACEGGPRSLWRGDLGTLTEAGQGKFSASFLPRPGKGDGAAIIYTSGSTGFPKGVVLSAGNLDYSTSVMVDFLGLAHGDRSLVSMPFTHCAGLLHLLAMIRCGGSVVTGESPALAGPFFKAVERNAVTGLPAVPSLAGLFLNRHGDQVAKRLRGLRWMELSSAPCGPPLVAALARTLPGVALYNTYGLTEAPRATYCRMENGEAATSVGAPTREVSVEVLDPDGRSLPPGSTGELVVSGPNVATGYWGRPEEARKRFTERGFMTGDMGYRDEEGNIHLRGRVDHMVKIGGESVHPLEVERVVATVPGVVDAWVYGEDDPLRGNILRAKVVKGSEALSEKDVLRHCRKSLEGFKVPASVDFCDEIPRNGAGKVEKGGQWPAGADSKVEGVSA